MSKVLHEVRLADGDVRSFHAMTMGDYDQLQAFLNGLPRPKAELADFTDALALAAEAFSAQVRELAASGVEPKVVERVLAGFGRQSLAVIQDQAREARYEAGAWPPVMGDEKAAILLFTAPGGKQRLVLQMLRQHDPKATIADAEAAFAAMDYADWMHLVAVAFDTIAAPEAGDDDPKA